jgi:hypothetical protein
MTSQAASSYGDANLIATKRAIINLSQSHELGIKFPINLSFATRCEEPKHKHMLAEAFVIFI